MRTVLWRLAPGLLAFAAMACSGTAGYASPATSVSHGGPAPGASGCRSWAPIFRPVLNVLAEGKVLVALPTSIPAFPGPVYAHASILQPPLTYSVILTPMRVLTTGGPALMAFQGEAGKDLRGVAGSRLYWINGRPIYLETRPGTYGPAAVWYDARDNITYTTFARRSLPVATLLQVVGSLTPAALVRSPITNSPSSHIRPACP